MQIIYETSAQEDATLTFGAKLAGLSIEQYAADRVAWGLEHTRLNLLDEAVSLAARNIRANLKAGKDFTVEKDVDSGYPIVAADADLADAGEVEAFSDGK